MQHILLGSIGENFAVRLLESLGYKVVGRNFRTKVGEIDIIAFYGQTLVFVEVKTRSNTNHGLPQEAVNKKRISRITKAGQIFIKKYYPTVKKINIQVVSLIIKEGKLVYKKIIDAF
jgi:putative endonuclease